MAIRDNGERPHGVHTPKLIPGPVKAAVNIPRHSLVMRNSGLLVPASSATASLGFVGVALQGLDNTNGADGVLPGGKDLAAERVIEVDAAGHWDFAITGTPPVAGQPAYVVNSTTVSADETGQNYVAGRFEYPGELGWYINIEENA